MDVFTTELGQLETIVTKEIQSEKLYVLENFGKTSDIKYVKGWDLLQHRKIQKHDVVYNMRHMHEPAVIEDHSVEICQDYPSKIAILHKDNDLLVINKPSGIPTHPTSNYRLNSVTEILKHDLQLPNVWPGHRLDKLTSGVLILGLNKPTVHRLMKIIEHKLELTGKLYYARVRGEFPSDPFEFTSPVFLLNINGGYLMPTNLQALPTNSTTRFKRVEYNSELNESVVECTPISGKMHQIRIHLRNLGYPITNDFVYNNINVEQLSEVNKYKNNIELEIYQNLYKKYPHLNTCRPVGSIPEDQKVIDITEFLNNDIEKRFQEVRQLALDRLQQYRNDECSECGRQLYDLERQRDQSFIYLHAHQYTFAGDTEFGGFDFKTNLPSWCNLTNSNN